MPDLITDRNLTPFGESRFRDALRARGAGMSVGNIHLFHEITSTNDEALRLARNRVPERTLVLAERQTAGRGRRGNSWAAPASRDLLFSLVLYPPLELSAERLSRLPHLGGVALCHAIEEVCPGIEAKLKWPNDIYMLGKKVAGILIENGKHASQTFSVLGIGINVNSVDDERPQELRATATSLREETGATVDRHELLAAFFASFDRLYPAGLEDFGGVLSTIEDRSLLLGRKISAQLERSSITGKAVEFGANGELIVEVENGGHMERCTLNGASQVRLI